MRSGLRTIKNPENSGWHVIIISYANGNKHYYEKDVMARYIQKPPKEQGTGDIITMRYIGFIMPVAA